MTIFLLRNICELQNATKKKFAKLLNSRDAIMNDLIINLCSGASKFLGAFIPKEVGQKLLEVAE